MKLHPHKKKRRFPEPAKNNVCQIYGLHAAEAALANPARTILHVWTTPNAAHRLEELLIRRSLTGELTSPRDLDERLGGEAIHQGVLIEAAPLPSLGIEDLAKARLCVALDQVTDPHNVGAVLRSCAAFGADALIMTAHHSPPLSGALAKAASGGLEAVPVVLVPNLARALAQFGEMGFERIGLEGDADIFLEDAALDAPVVLVLGAEDKGMRRLTREHCDQLCALKTADRLRSLNVSNAAAIALHLAFQKQRSRS